MRGRRSAILAQCAREEESPGWHRGKGTNVDNDPDEVKARGPLQLWREKNPEKYKAQGRRAYAARRKKKYPLVSAEMLRLCREDPRTAVGMGSLAGFELAVCLECGEMHPALGAHIARQHMTVIAYRRKWGYAKNSPLDSAEVIQVRSAAGRRIAKANHPVPPAVNHARAAAGRRDWAGAREKRLNLRDAHLRRLRKGLRPTFTRKKKNVGGRPATKRSLFLQAKAMRDARRPWSAIAKALDPEGFRGDWRAAVERLRTGVRGLKIEKQ
jgi:hypothetical protein